MNRQRRWCSGYSKCASVAWGLHKWCSHTVTEILDRQEYVGDTVNFRTYRQSFKLKKQLDKPQKEASGGD